MSFAWDVAPGPGPGPVGLVIMGVFLAMIVWEGGILALLGMRPIDKAFVSSFLVNMAACAVGFVMFVMMTSLRLQGNLSAALILLSVIFVQGLILGKYPVNLSLGRAWIAAVVMKLVSFAIIGVLIYSFDY
jgi:hypothetical protein